jgi:hypothetical protein
MRLPPIGRIIGDAQAEADAVEFLNGLVIEARAARERYDPFVQVCLRLYDYGLTYVPNANDDKIVIHSIQNAVIAQTLQQTQNPPQISLQPVETGEPPTYYWAGPADIGASLGLPIEQLIDHPDMQTGEVSPPAPMDSMQAEAMEGMAFSPAEAPMLPPGTVRPDWIVPLNDAKSAEVLQIPLDVIWKRSEIDEYVAEDQLNTNIRGWMTLHFDFDTTRKRVLLRELPQQQVYLDPTVRDVPDMMYAGFDVVLDACDAAARYPDLADLIYEKSEARQLGGRAYRPIQSELSETQDIDYRRATVTLRVFWIRNQQTPMHREEAIAAGKLTVQTQQVPSAMPDPTTGLPGLEEQPVVDETGQPVLLLAGTGQPVTEGDPAWPLRLGIRQMTMVDDQLAEDVECPHWDIPLITNVNIPTSETSPFGFGEPLRMKPLQQAESVMVDAMVMNARFAGYPVEWIPTSVADELPNKGKNAYVKPGQRYIIDDDLLRNLPNNSLIGIQQPPPMPPALAEVAGYVGEKFKEISGHTDVAQGIAPSATASGKMVELLQTAQSSITAFKAKRTNRVLKRIAMLTLHQIVWGMTVEDLEQIVSQYPRHVLDAFHTRWRLMEWNVKAEVQTGNGGPQMQKRQLATMDLQNRMISPQTYCEDTGRDYDLEQQRLTQYDQRQARLAALMGPPPGEEDPDASKEKGEKGDKGKAPANARPS